MASRSLTSKRARRDKVAFGPRALAVVVALVASSCAVTTTSTGVTTTSAATTTAVSKSITLGFLGGLTGPNAQLGIQVDNGARLAVNDFNATSGRDLAGGGYDVANPATTFGPATPVPVPTVNWITLDSRDLPSRAVALAQRAIGQRVVGLVGPVLGADSAAADPVLEQAGIVNVTASATQSTLADNGWKYWHRIVADDGTQAAAGSAFLAGTINARSVAVVDDSSVSGRGLAAAIGRDLSAAGVAVVLTASVDGQGLADPTVAASVESADADAVYFAGTASEAAAFLTQLRTIGVQSVFVTDGAADSTDLIRLAGAQVANGTFLTCPCVDPEASPQGEAFAEGYKSAYGKEPGPYAVEGFDAANLILRAVAAGRTTPLAINSYLADHSFKGISKTITFDSRGQVTSGVMSLMEVQNGALVYEGPLVS